MDPERPQAVTRDAVPSTSPQVRGRVSAVVICGNEEANIEACLSSVSWCDEIVVVDSQSTDRSAEIARRYTDRVFQRPWPGYVAQKNFALEQATGDWILSLDADERCTAELRGAIEKALASPGDAAGFRFKRRVRYLGRWILHGGWYPDWKLRLVRRGRARWEGRDPHDKLVADGPVRDVNADLLHFTYRNFAHQIRTINHFSDVVTDTWRRDGKRGSFLKMLVLPPAKFIECWIFKLGILDGLPGLIIALSTAFYVFSKQVKLWEPVDPGAMRRGLAALFVIAALLGGDPSLTGQDS